jgi:hypothetical protein
VDLNESQQDALTRIADEGLPGVVAEMAILRSEVRLARRSWRMMLVAMIVGGLTVAGVFWAFHQQDVDREAAGRQYNLDQCARSNMSRQTIAEAFDKQRDALITAAGPARSPEGQARLDEYNRSIDELVASFGSRDCVALLKKAGK